MTKLKSNEVPQGGGLAKLVRLVKHLATGGSMNTFPPFKQKRDRIYHRDAARILRLLDAKDALTVAGLAVASEPDDCLDAVTAAFAASRIGAVWLEWANVTSVADLSPASTDSFLAACSPLSAKTRSRRATTLRSWLTAMKGRPPLSGGSSGEAQLSLDDRLHPPKPPWPTPGRFPHNEDGQRVESVLFADMLDAEEVLIVTGYAALDQVVRFLATRTVGPSSRIRLLFGNEPYPNRTEVGYPAKQLDDEMREYWLSHNISIVLSGAVLRAIDVLGEPNVYARIARRRRPVHAKVYVTPTTATLGSSNFTDRGLGLVPQAEANARFVTADDAQRHAEASDFGEALWTLGYDFKAGLIELLAQLVQSVSWQEALARACAGVLEGEWAKRYVVPAEFASALHPPWPHQLEGMSQALWVLEHVGSVLVADAPGSGKTTLGSWLLRGAYDRQVRTGGARTTSPVVIAPPMVMDTWQDALQDAHLPWVVHSHGYLSSAAGRGQSVLMRALAEADLLAVDEAHNYLNVRSTRTRRVLSHYAEHAILFTATPINRNAGDLIAIIELLGADNLSDEALGLFTELTRMHRGEIERADSELLERIREEIRKFVVRRTRNHLNAIVARDPARYAIPGGRTARYPRIKNTKFECAGTEADRRIASEIRELAVTLHGVARFPRALELPDALRIDGVSEEQYVNQLVASGQALARHYVLDSLRSSRAAVIEHVHGTAVAWDECVLSDRKLPRSKNATGNVLAKLKSGRARIPEWRLKGLDRGVVPAWLTDLEAHAVASDHDHDVYTRIADLARNLSSSREDAKLDLLERLAKDYIVLAFDSHLITLAMLEARLIDRKVPVTLFTGEHGKAGKDRAKQVLGRDTAVRNLVALCSDVLSEGGNLQGASNVVHLNTPTVIRLAEQRAGRVDRMDSPHDEVEVWWPNEPPEFAPRKRDLLRERHRLVGGLIGVNLTLPVLDASDEVVRTDDLVEVVAKQTHDAAEQIFDAFQPVRDLIGEDALVPTDVYEQIRGTQTAVVSRISIVASEAPWCFLALGGVLRQAPRWILFQAPDATPNTDLSTIAAELRRRLGPSTKPVWLDAAADVHVRAFLDRVRVVERDLLPPRRRRALHLLDRILEAYALNVRVNHRKAELDEIAAIVRADPAFPHPDPRAVADAWLRFLGPRIRAAFAKRRRRGRRPWKLDDMWDELVADPLDVPSLCAALQGVPMISPADERVVALIVGVPSK